MDDSPLVSTENGLTIEQPSTGLFRLKGALDAEHLSPALEQLTRHAKRSGQATLDLTALERLDTAGALLLHHLQQQGWQLTKLQPHHQELIALIAALSLQPPPQAAAKGPIGQVITQLGKKAADAWQETKLVIAFIGQTSVVLARLMRQPSRLRLPSIARHIREIGIYAIPIIGLMAFMISIVLAYQGVAQLRPYGGERFTVNLVTISLLREMGVLLTAIMVAGRSGSAFTAEIGVMKAREEVDALQVSGVEPFEMLVIPRLIAIIITLPLLTFLADIMGLIGGGLISLTLLDMSLTQYINQLHDAAKLKDFFVGMSKAPVFAFFIAIIGCLHGLRVTGSAESVGRQTTASVVKSIFLVLTLDALFSIFFQQMGW